MTATHPGRIPLNTLAIGFGLAGLAEAWSAAAEALALPRWLPQIFWVIAAVAWLWLIVAHLSRGARSDQRLLDQLRHPAQGPIAALVPVTGMLLGADLSQFWRFGGRVLVITSIAAAAVFGGWLIATWLDGRLALEAVHGGYLLPTVAAGLVGADAAAAVGYPQLGWALFGAGAFFSVILTTLLILRLAFWPRLPDPLVPTIAILVAPPAVGGLAWFALTGHRVSPVAAGLGGLAVLLTLVQAGFLPRYRRLAFSLGFWSFTFPAGAVAADAITWLAITRPVGGRVAVVVLLAAITSLVGAIAARSIPVVERRLTRAAAVSELSAADDADARPAHLSRT